MASFTIKEVQQASGAEILHTGAHESFDGISTDTRTIREGNLFIALSGENFDGHRFVRQAVEKGAYGVVVSRADAANDLPESVSVFLVKDTKKALEGCARFHRLRFNIPVIGVTGSNGKTTTKDMISAVLGTTYSVCRTVANHNNEIGMCQTLLSLKKEHGACVVEMGMRGFGQIEELCTFARPTIGVVTNVGTSHIGILGSQDNIAKAKGELVEALGSEGTAILNGDDARVLAMKDRFTGKTVTYGLHREDVCAEHVEYKPDRTEFDCNTPSGTFHVTLFVLGMHNVYDAMAAIATGEVCGVSHDRMKQALADYRGASQRQAITTLGGVRIMDDSYNANPLSMEMAFRSLMQMEAKRRILVLGDMLELGDDEERYHYETGAKAGDMHVDAVITVGPLGRCIANGARDHGVPHVESFDTTEQAAGALKKYMQDGDLILLKASHSMHMDNILKMLGGTAE